MLMTLAPMTAFAADTKGSATNPFTTVNEYNNAVKDNGMNGQDVYLTISNTEFNSTSNPFNLTNVQSRANPPKLHLTLTGCTFTGNTSGESAQTGNPSFMYLPNCQELVIDNCTFDAGESGLKYGINWNLIQIQDATVSITNSSFTGKFTKNPLKLNQRNGSDDAATDVKNNGTWTEKEIIPASITSAVIENCTFNCTKDGNTPNNVIQLGSQGKGANDGAAPSTGAFPVTIAAGSTPITVEMAYDAANGATIGTVPVDANTVVTKAAGTDPVKNNDAVVAKIDDTPFITLAAAVSAAENGDTVTMLKAYDATSEGTITLYTGKKVTLDLGGNKLTLSRFNLKHGWLTVQNGSVSCEGQAFNVYSGATAIEDLYTKLVIKDNVTINAAYGICLFPEPNSNAGYRSAIEVYGKIERGGIFISGNLGNDTTTAKAMVQNSDKIPTVTIYDGAVVNNGTEGQGIAMNGLANVTVNGGTISGSEAIGVKRGTLTVNGGTFTSNGTYVDPAEANNNGTENTGATISITGTYNYAGTISVTLKGGTFTSKNSPAVYLGHSEKNNALVPYTNGVTLDIQGGTFTSENSQVTPVFVADTTSGDASTYTKQVISGGTFLTSGNTKSDVSTYLVTGVQQDANGTIVPADNSVAKIGSVGYDSLSEAIAAAKNGGTVTLLQDITDANVGTPMNSTDTIQVPNGKSITIIGNGKSITLTPQTDDGRAQVFSVPEGSLTLDNVNLTINGLKTAGTNGYGDGFDVWGTLNIKNGSSVNISGVTSAFTMQGGYDAKVNIENSTVTAENIKGNFSNGGEWKITESFVDIKNCTYNALSLNKLTVDASTVMVDGAGFRGIIITDTDKTEGNLEIINGSTVTLKNCCNTTDSQYAGTYRDGVAVKMNKDATNSVSFIVGEGSKLDAGKAKIALSTNSNSTNTMAGTIVGTIVSGSNTDETFVAAIDGGSGYTTLDAAVDAAISGKTVRILVTDAQTLTKAIKEDVTLVIANGQTVTVDLATMSTNVQSMKGTISVEAGGKLIAKTGSNAEDVINMIGDENYNLQLTSGKINVSLADLTSGKIVGINFVGAKAEVPTNGYWTLTMTSGGINAKMNVTLDASSELTVSGSLRIANGATLTNSGKLTVNNGGLLRVGSDGKIEGNGTITNSGNVTLHKGTDTTATVNPTITLTSTGAVYSEFDAASMVGPSGNVSSTTGEFTVDGVTSGTPAQPVTFTHKYTYYTPSGGGGGGGGTTTYSVTLPADVANGTLSVSPKSAAKDATVTITVTPDEGYQLATLTVTDKDGKTVEVTKKSDTQYTFTMPASKVSIQASFAPVETPPATLPFTDVDGHWALDAITYVYENGMMNGTSPTTFSPESQLTRGMIVTILYRLEDEPAVSDSTFSDVDGDMYYADPIAWAADNGIVTGFPDGTFGPETSITREQLATILYRYADYLDCDMTPAADLSGYTDAGTISAYAQQAMAWANAEGLITGVTETTLKPTGTATRAQVATILMRFCENVIK